ncbi:MAG: alanine--tRNA ligase [Sphingomonadaceae bacterium]|uniref:alanine--tRNA ligase n=1 Tax=Thermaurantiacus sp. TaxID=2820283 RepID=UPI00298F10B5|nr:alanine--tRNA ligase [Thermaurantiacus sp.]MCS6985965.1 alanine--tRNA ligase [Sphingomonadaceae bacterium]MDW8414819.1 alanine--tRNA ligase [Thermaurantiacus sp.]
MTSTDEIRRSFLEHFAAAGHDVVPSAPLVPRNDPTLMFVNAGMVPFKNLFTGVETRAVPRVASVQKCVRAGGKHNDLDNVGYTPRHHTFFEMLGNFSFGDYFKDEAIRLAWDLLTRTWGVPAERLWVTVYHDDDEAFDLWRRISGLSPERIRRIATSDNFWSMGDTGPCGPCSEIFFDHGPHLPGGPPGSAAADGDRFVEIWNLVFMQYEQLDATTRVPLPRPSIDTGMGLERIAAVLQGTHDNFATDVFRQLILASAELTRTAPDAPATRVSHRVIADHVRAAGFLIADGVLPANEGRGYVLRRILRRAMRHANLLGTAEPLMHRLVPTLITAMGGAWPELVRARPLIEETLRLEEARFRQTLEKGLKLLDEATADLSPGAVLPGEVAFRLYDTYGFPLDLTEDAVKAQGLSVDRAGFEAAMAEQRRRARAAWVGSGEAAADALWFELADRHGATEFVGYATTEAEGLVQALVRDGREVTRAGAGERVDVLVNQTPFYAEAGGQVGDTGEILGDAGLRLVVDDTVKPLGRLHLHRARVVAGEIRPGLRVRLVVDAARRAAIRANHSATHLLHAALRQVLGPHVAQKGSLVAPDRLRFDFSHPRAVREEELARIEDLVNAEILANAPAVTRLMTPEAAIAAGALALFGEKYGDEVRVLELGRTVPDTGRPFSVELCGGTHVSATGDIGLFLILSESAVAAGVRRIEAVTGEAARRYAIARDRALKEAARVLKVAPEEVPARVEALVEAVRRLERDLADARRRLALAGPAEAARAEPERVAGVAFLGRVVDDVAPRALKGLADEAKARLGSGVVAIVGRHDGRASVVVGVTDDLTGPLSAIELVRAAAQALGGQGGGGRPDLAQAGGPEAGRAAEALAAVREGLRSALGVPA